MRLQDPSDAVELDLAKAVAPCESDRPQPELGRAVVAVYVDVRRFVRLVAVEVYLVRSFS
jgi:hypothetical protein